MTDHPTSRTFGNASHVSQRISIPGMPGYEGGPPSPAFEVSWELFGELCRALALRVYREYDPDLVVGIATAGVIPAAVIADILQIDFYGMKISRRSDRQRVSTDPVLYSTAPVQAAGRRVLLVDEITTSGDTLRLALASLRDVGPAEVRTATCFSRPAGYQPDYHALATDDLIVFPWDRQVIEAGQFVVHPTYRASIDPA
ncbi:MAG: phosphoribosyl transferase [Gemmatimonadota bacterium]|jgi:hypoxanthine phosphoribosyltransferase|nr:phosphoribosyl transferase [Gemmatimonadota bacterium]